MDIPNSSMTNGRLVKGGGAQFVMYLQALAAAILIGKPIIFYKQFSNHLGLCFNSLPHTFVMSVCKSVIRKQ